MRLANFNGLIKTEGLPKVIGWHMHCKVVVIW